MERRDRPIHAMNPSEIRGITFDVGGTLIEPWPSVGHVYAEVAARHGWKDIPPDALNAKFRSAWKTCADFNYTKAGWENLVNQTFAGLGPGPVSFFPELYERFAEPEVWRVYNDVRATLAELRSRGLRLGVISNWDERLPQLLRRLDLEDCFDSFAISCEVGAVKPSAVIFARSSAGLGLPPGSLLHVGDSRELDVHGAKAAGFRAVRIERGEGVVPAGEIRSLRELPAMLAGAISPR
jgi:putative hydrolase of the HAD superfamily